MGRKVGLLVIGATVGSAVVTTGEAVGVVVGAVVSGTAAMEGVEVGDSTVKGEGVGTTVTGVGGTSAGASMDGHSSNSSNPYHVDPA